MLKLRLGGGKRSQLNFREGKLDPKLSFKEFAVGCIVNSRVAKKFSIVSPSKRKGERKRTALFHAGRPILSKNCFATGARMSQVMLVVSTAMATRAPISSPSSVLSCDQWFFFFLPFLPFLPLPRVCSSSRGIVSH